MAALLSMTPFGLYCAKAKVFIDPFKPVANAIITHAHADHARPGSRKYLCSRGTQPVMRYRLGRHTNIQALPYGKSITINQVAFSFHPAGHIPGSSQVRIEYKGEVWVVSGDYKLQVDGISEPFEPIACHTFITESTFAKPQFVWPDSNEVHAQINSWWRQYAAFGKTTILAAYALGKAQRILKHLDSSIGTIYCHPSVENINQILRNQGLELPATKRLTRKKKELGGAIIITTPGAMRSAWLSQFDAPVTAMATGWTLYDKLFKKFKVQNGFTLSDHADWPGILQAIEQTGAQRIYTLHGQTERLAKHLRSLGYEAAAME